MALVAVKPPIELFVIRKGRHPISWYINDKLTLITFKKPQQALMVASLIESHYRSNKEWPTKPEFFFSKEVIPVLLEIETVDYNYIQELCALWHVKLLVLEDIKTTKNPKKFEFIGEVETFDVRKDKYIEFLEELYIN